MRTRLDLTAAMHVKPGDWLAGHYVPDAPTTPVQLLASALQIAAAAPFTDDAGVKWLRFTRAGEVAGPWGSLTPVRAYSQVFVIRITP